MELLKVIVDQHASADAKIAFFRSLFRGREGVYPRRFESRKTGKSRASNHAQVIEALSVSLGPGGDRLLVSPSVRAVQP
jgi:hypothetical protein